MLTPDHIEEAKEVAKKQLQDKAFKAAVEAHKEHLKAKKAHFLPRRVVFQWPIRLEHWVKPIGACNTYNGAC